MEVICSHLLGGTSLNVLGSSSHHHGPLGTNCIHPRARRNGACQLYRKTNRGATTSFGVLEAKPLMPAAQAAAAATEAAR